MTELNLNIDANKPYRIEYPGYDGAVVHIFEDDEVEAIKAAYAARRPLLVRGEPGVGKSQLAAAAAVADGRALVQKVVSIRTEPQDLLWTDDPIARLADAQLLGAATSGASSPQNLEELRQKIEHRARYFSPGVFWWALNWDLAAKYAAISEQAPPSQPKGCNPEKGVVALIDEIDKAETDLPNGLLEVLGAREFTPDFFKDGPIRAKENLWPLIVVTTNEERELPAAFMRRCVVLNISFPGDKETLFERAKAHLDGQLHDDAIDRAIELLLKERKAVGRHERLRPGQAEFIDLLNAVALRTRGDGRDKQLARMDQIAQFFLKKSKPVSS